MGVPGNAIAYYSACLPTLTERRERGRAGGAGTEFLAIHRGCMYVATDRDCARFPSLRWRHPLN
jgi:hypothetical protein